MKISALAVLTTPAPSDSVPILDDSADTTKQITLATLLAMIYPIGSLYFNATDNTNPGTLFGFGTWVATAVGRVPVGKSASDAEFDTAGETGGAKTHFHWQTVGMDAGNFFGEVDGAGSGHTRVIVQDRSVVTSGSRGTTGTRGDGTYDESSLQPYEVYYIWKRTA